MSFDPVALFLWRKDRAHRLGPQILLSLSVALGVCALVALEAFSLRIERSIEHDSRSLLSADLQIQAWRPLAPVVLASAEALAGARHVIRQTDFVATALVPKSGTSLTVQVRALEGNYPFYGNWKTEPQLRVADLAARPSALVDVSLRARGFHLGDVLRIGQLDLPIAAFITDEPQTVASAFALGPRVIIHQRWAAATHLLDAGSRAFYMLLIKTAMRPQDFRAAFRKKVPDPHWRVVTPERANRQAESVIHRVRAFLSFVALSAVLLGGVGVFMIFRAQFLLRLPQILSLRCLGLRRRSLVIHALLEALGVALLGWALGGLLAWRLESWLAHLALRVLGTELSPVSYVQPLLLGAAVSLLTVVVAVALPLREILRVPVAAALREAEAQTRPLTLSDGLGCGVAVLALILLVGREWQLVLGFSAGLGAVALLLYVLAWGISKLLLRFKLQRPLVLKHALLAYGRRAGSSQLLTLSLGLGIFLLAAILALGFSLRSQIDISHRLGLPNLFLLGVADENRGALEKILPGAEFVPVTQARLTEIKGRPIAERDDSDPSDVAQFHRVREYTVTRRTALSEGERVTRGNTLFGPPLKDRAVRASLEAEFAGRIDLKVGDRFGIEIAGVALPAQVVSLRKVDWFNFRPNFFIVLDADDVKDAPMDYVGLYRVPRADMPAWQRRISTQFPQISPLDGEAVSLRLRKLLDQLSFAIAAVSFFTLGSCFFVFLGILVTRRPQNLREISLWRCLGLRRGPLRILMSTEFALTGLVAGLASLSAALLLAAALCRWVLDVPFVLAPLWLIGASLLLLPLCLGGGAWLYLAPLIGQSPARLFRAAEEL